ncbi:MAG: hypothetical protein P0Y49_05330 [Candidatus Pedobacter colombiensis]|uniref:YD repeat-containing protein n=1 Tax=Candidatus Pedobacter colombiensis TaxID=3121371 RepID=A0AAJ5W8F8_9SPHI|nr:hypothetical protein [Pedobacter sp.]WEK20558.1 MAG: hypothetical protein P0Y49_05330 [Pedobacter sp.]
MSNLKHYRFVPLIALLLVLACKKNRTSKIEIPEPEPPHVTKTLIPIKFEATGLTINLKYKENTPLLTEISDAAGAKTLFTYTSDQYLSKIEKYNNGKLFYVGYYQKKDDEKMISKVVLFNYDDLKNNYTPKGFYTLTYNLLQQLSTIQYYNNANNLIDTRSQFYTTAKNLSEVDMIDNSGSINVNTYTFDQKKGIASNMDHAQLFALESEHWFLICSGNNLLSYRNQKSPLENTDFSYEYNGDGYPSKMTITKNKNTQQIKITYKSIEP